MMPINWLVESFKWQLLMSPFQKISFYSGLKTVMSGVAAGVVTPARVGEYAGRMVTSSNHLKTEAAVATFLGSISQNFWNLTGGAAFSYIFLKDLTNITHWNKNSFFIITAVSIVIMMTIYFNVPKVASKLIKWKYFKKFENHISNIGQYSNRLLVQVLFLSLIRYLIYFGQYVLVMIFLGADIDLLQMIAIIATIYLIQSGLPLPAFMSIIARGEVAVLMWSLVGIGSIMALSATFIIWIINLILPALLGLFFLSKTNLYRFFKNESN